MAGKRYYKKDETPSENFNNELRLEGRNPVMEALRSNRPIDKIYVQNGEKNGSVLKILSLAREKRIPVMEVEKNKLDKALAMDIISQEEYDVKLSSAKKKVDNFEAIRKIEMQYDMKLISKEELDEMIKTLNE